MQHYILQLQLFLHSLEGTISTCTCYMYTYLSMVVTIPLLLATSLATVYTCLLFFILHVHCLKNVQLHHCWAGTITTRLLSFFGVTFGSCFCVFEICIVLHSSDTIFSNVCYN